MVLWFASGSSAGGRYETCPASFDATGRAAASWIAGDCFALAGWEWTGAPAPTPTATAAAAAAPVVAVSPFVDGQVLKGPTAAFLPTHEAVVAHYGDLVDGWLTDLWLGDAEARSRGAAEVLAFVKGLSA